VCGCIHKDIHGVSIHPVSRAYIIYYHYDKKFSARRSSLIAHIILSSSSSLPSLLSLYRQVIVDARLFDYSFFTVPIPKWKIFRYVHSCTVFHAHKRKYRILKLKRYEELWIIYVDRRVMAIIIKKICTHVYAIVTPNWCYSRTYIIHIAPIHTLTLILCIMYISYIMYMNTICRI